MRRDFSSPQSIKRDGKASEQSATRGQDTDRGAVQQEPQSTPASPVLQEALSKAHLSDEARAALRQYCAALQTLAGRGDAQYRSGVLEQAQKALEQIAVPASLGATVEIMKDLFVDCIDVIFRSVLIGGRHPSMLLLIDGMVAEERIELSVLSPLMQWNHLDRPPQAGDHLPAWLEAAGVAINQAEPVKTIAQAVDAVLGGDVVLFIDGIDQAIKLSSRGWRQRAVEEPSSETIIRGPREGFVESLRTNTMLLRRRLKTPQLKIERIVLGRRTKTLTDMIYLKDIADPKLVNEVRQRLQRIDVDSVLDTAIIEQLIEDQPSSIFPQIANTERPDRVTASLLEGRVAILADGSPFALLLPVTFWSLMQADEDYYERFWFATFIRWLRYLFATMALLGPSLYIAITTFHQEMVPTSLLLSIAAAREEIPFPALIEALIMEAFFEALREAGLRLPRPVGQAVSIVGALVIGQAAVQAGLVSAPVVIIVASTGIASFTFPRFNLGIALRLLRFPMMVLAGIGGLFGIIVGTMALSVHLAALRSFGVPYLQPLAPLTWGSLKDVLMRAPQWMQSKRPSELNPMNPRRQKPHLKPGPGGNRA